MKISVKKASDSMNNKIIRLLREDGRMAVGETARRQNVATPTVRSRLESLEKEACSRFASYRSEATTENCVRPSCHKHALSRKNGNVVRSETFVVMKSKEQLDLCAKGVEDIHLNSWFPCGNH